MEAIFATQPPLRLTQTACQALDIARSSLFRHRARLKRPVSEPNKRAKPPRALSAAERRTVRDILLQPRFADQAPAEVYAALLDEGAYHCLIRTMYRILGEHGEVRERRRQRRHPIYAKPELLAMGPNQVWSWDITKLMGPVKWNYFYLYVIIDIFSRRVVGWRVADTENASLFKELFHGALAGSDVSPGQLTLHADLGVAKSHSRPHTSNDNPFSEAHFKTLKYQPEFPKRFETAQQAEDFCRRFFEWYNQDHHHGGIGLMTPDQVHYGQAEAVHAARQAALDNAFRRNPERFVAKKPEPPAKPNAVWINPPDKPENFQV